MSNAPMRMVFTVTVATALVAVPGRAPAAVPCDCNGDGTVTVNELVTAVNLALGQTASCAAADADGNGVVNVADLVRGVNAALGVGLTPRPMIRQFKIVGNDVVEIRGTGVPGTDVWVDTRQAPFHNKGAATFKLCPWYNDGAWLGLGNVTRVGPDGTWVLTDVERQVMPPVVLDDDNCHPDMNIAGALLTEFRVGSQYGVDEPPAPQIAFWHKRGLGTAKTHLIEVDVVGGHDVAVGITDGPDQAPMVLGGVDEDEDGIDACNTRGLACGQLVSFGSMFAAPSITETDATECSVINGCMTRDHEYNFILSMAQAHKPGGSMLAFMRTRRWAPPKDGAVIHLDVDVDINADFTFGLKLFGLGS